MKIKITIVSFFTLLMFAACTNVLNLEPAQNLSNDEVLNSDQSVKQVLVGAYNQFSVESLFGGNVLRNSELYGGEGELNWLGSYVGPREIFQRDILITNDDVLAFWEDAYSCINICNNVLSAIKYVNSDDSARVKGEAKFLRGWVYFELTRYFGQQYEPGQTNSQLAVPIVLQPTQTLSDNSQVSRNTVEECYSQVLSDLKDAENLLPTDNGKFANSYAASAILSRVYLQQEDYTDALTEADRVISSNAFALVPDYADEFGTDDNSTEDIFSIQISAKDGINAMNEYFSTSAYGGRGDIQIEQEFVDLFKSADTRKALFYKIGNKWRCGKFNNEFGNLAVIRLAEMYLIRAECNERLGTETGDTPLNDYNVVHTRAGLKPATSVSLDDILFERRLELADEGFKVWDVKRLHGVIGTMPYNDPKMVFPVPERELEVNLNLVQNPGY